MPVLLRGRFLLVACLAASLRADEKSPAPAAPPEDAIAAAKRDYDLIKGAKSPASDLQRSDLPRLETPAMHVSGDEMASFLQSQTAQTKKADELKRAKAENWLVEAMKEKKPATRDGAKSLTRAATEEDPLASPPTEDREGSAEETKPMAESAKPPAADNPLASYMSGWMTPNDRELLKVKSGENALPAMPGKGPDAPLLDDLLPRDPVDGGGANPVTTALAEPRANPYLADLAAGSMPPAGGGPKEPFSLPAPNLGGGYLPVPVVVPPVPNDPAPVKTGLGPVDLLKPSDDTKYFPQLKRF